MQVSFTLLERDLVEFNLFHHDHSPTARRVMRRLKLMVALVAIMLALLSILNAQEPGQALYPVGLWLVAGVVVLVALQLLWPRVVKGNARKLISEGVNRTMLGPRVVTISPEGISQRTNYSDSKYFWPCIERIVTNADYAFVYLSALSAIIIPRAAFKTAEEFEAFVATARQYVEGVAPRATPPLAMVARANSSGHSNPERP